MVHFLCRVAPPLCLHNVRSTIKPSAVMSGTPVVELVEEVDVDVDDDGERLSAYLLLV